MLPIGKRHITATHNRRNKMKRTVCFILSAAMLVLCAAPAFAASGYGDLISGVLDDMSSNNARCSGAPQQLANGLYRCVEMAAIIATIQQ